MLRNDGDYTIYIIQYTKDKPGEEWNNSGDCTQFIKKVKTREQQDKIAYSKPFESISACNECWQKTGIHGTFDLKMAMAVFQKIFRWFPKYRFRVAELKISQHITQIAEAKFNVEVP